MFNLAHGGMRNRALLAIKCKCVRLVVSSRPMRRLRSLTFHAVQRGNNLVANTYGVPGVFANKPLIAGVAIVMKEIFQEATLLMVFYHPDCQVFVFGDCAFRCSPDEKDI